MELGDEIREWDVPAPVEVPRETEVETRETEEVEA